jgi:hypothetical protein
MSKQSTIFSDLELREALKEAESDYQFAVEYCPGAARYHHVIRTAIKRWIDQRAAKTAHISCYLRKKEDTKRIKGTKTK